MSKATSPSVNTARAETSGSSVSAKDSGSHPAAAAAPKDRACPYCHINFTSSSLGRHLDLYIKEKHPKPPDGIHNIEEIRQSRGQITRRQAKSKKPRDQDTPDGSKSNGGPAGSASPAVSQSEKRRGPYAYLNLFNSPHWTSTGVITDSDANQRLMNGDGAMNEETPGSGSGSNDLSTKRKWMEERERGRAAELALQELVDSIKATSQSAAPPVYDFDFLSMSFAELCLRILPPPESLQRASWSQDPGSWTIEPPGELSFRALRDKIRKHIIEWRMTYYPPNSRKRRRGGSPETSCNDTDALEPLPLYQAHLLNQWNVWSTMAFAQKAQDWHMCSLAAYAREHGQHVETKKRLEFLETELNRANIVNARLTECQMPREWLHTPATQLPVAKLEADRIRRELKNGLDAEKLIAKWRPRVHAARPMARQSENDQDGMRLATTDHAGAATARRRQPATVANGSNHEGRTASYDEDTDGEGEREDDDGESDDNYEEAAEAMNGTKGTIEPSLKRQWANMGA